MLTRSETRASLLTCSFFPYWLAQLDTQVIQGLSRHRIDTVKVLFPTTTTPRRPHPSHPSMWCGDSSRKLSFSLSSAKIPLMCSYSDCVLEVLPFHHVRGHPVSDVHTYPHAQNLHTTPHTKKSTNTYARTIARARTHREKQVHARTNPQL